jgi:acetyltransferase-like isoleucine patch superfamily enzyme
MFELLAFLTNKRYWRLHSLFIRFFLERCGIKIGKKFYIEGVPRLKIHGKAQNIMIGDNVSILGDVDIRNRENGKIIFHNNITIERDCRFVSAREGKIVIGEWTTITAFAIINGGGDVIIGKKCIIGPRASINANEHRSAKRAFIKDQGFTHQSVYLEDDCWLGANVAINKGVHLARGSIIGANAVVTKDTEPFSINAGIPAKKIGMRT